MNGTRLSTVIDAKLLLVSLVFHLNTQVFEISFILDRSTHSLVWTLDGIQVHQK